MKLSRFHIVVSFCLISLIAACSGKDKKFVASEATTALTQEVVYEVNGQKMKGFLALPEGEGPFPGVIVVHEWWGLNDYPKDRARKFAENGYAAFAIDLYGDGKSFEHPTEAKTFSAKAMSNLKNTEQGFREAIKVFQANEKVDSKNLAVAGYCFGGAVALEMARRNVGNIKMVASYHGDLTPIVTNPVDKMKARVLIFNGGADPMVSKQTVDTARKKLRDAKVRFKFINYKDAKHAFTNPEASTKGEKFSLPLAYNKKADEDSWQKTMDALKIVFGSKK